jgi:hypothetical protein
MSEARARQVDFLLTIACPNCGMLWSFDLPELRAHYWKFECSCDETIRIDPVEKVTFHYKGGDEEIVWGKKKSKSKEKSLKKPKRSVQFPNVITSLTSLGYKSKESFQIVRDFVEKHEFSGSEEDLLPRILQEIRP